MSLVFLSAALSFNIMAVSLDKVATPSIDVGSQIYQTGLIDFPGNVNGHCVDTIGVSGKIIENFSTSGIIDKKLAKNTFSEYSKNTPSTLEYIFIKSVTKPIARTFFEKNLDVKKCVFVWQEIETFHDIVSVQYKRSDINDDFFKTPLSTDDTGLWMRDSFADSIAKEYKSHRDILTVHPK